MKRHGRPGSWWKGSRFRHRRKKMPHAFFKSTFKTVPVSHTSFQGKYRRGAKAIVGKLKSSGKWSVQSILTPIKKRKR